MRKPVFIFCMLIASMLIFVGCSFDLYKEAVARVSEAGMCLWETETSKFRISFTSGMREDPYLMNGIPETLRAFGLVVLEPKDESLSAVDEINATLTIGKENFNIVLERNPYEYNFGADIEKLFNNPSSVAVAVNAFNDVYNLTLANVAGVSGINWEKALRIGMDVLNAKSIIKNSKIRCEVYVKIVCDASKITDKHFWRVQIVTSKGDTNYCLINLLGEVIFKK